MLLFRHGPADDVGPAQGVPRQLPEDLHHLLLVEDAPGGGLQNGLEQGVPVLHLLRVLPALQIGGDKLHGPGPVQGHQGGQVLHAPGLCLGEQPLHPPGLELEHPHRVPLPQHLEHRRVVLLDLLHVEPRVPPGRELLGVVDHRQVPKSQEVHL